jgi:hypothetical protein
MAVNICIAASLKLFSTKCFFIDDEMAHHLSGFDETIKNTYLGEVNKYNPKLNASTLKSGRTCPARRETGTRG